MPWGEIVLMTNTRRDKSDPGFEVRLLQTFILDSSRAMPASKPREIHNNDLAREGQES